MNNKKLFPLALIFVIANAVNGQTLKDAIHLSDNEQYEAASTAFWKLITTEPVNGTNYFYFGENYLLSDNADSANIMYEKGNVADPANVLNAIGKIKYKLNKETKVSLTESAAMVDEVLLKAGPKNSLAYIEAADALIKFKNKNLDKAKLLLDKALALDAKNPEIQILYGDIYSELNNGSLAAEYYNKALELDKNSAKAIVSKGRLYKRSLNNEGASEEFQNAIKVDPAFAPAHRELGEIYFKLGKLEKAKEEYKTYLDLSKNNMSARIRYATFLYFSKDYSGALNEINQLSKMDENNLTLLRVAAYSYYETKDSAKALNAITKLFSKLDSTKATLKDYEYYGKILTMNNQDSVAAMNIRKAYNMDSGRTDLLTLLADIYAKMKKYPEAISTLEEKIRLGKDVKVADYLNLGRYALFNSDFIKADSAFMKVNELAPTYASGYLYRARANAYIDSTMEKGLAQPFYEKYVALAIADSANTKTLKYKSGLIESYEYLAAIYVRDQSKDYVKTKEYLQKILELDPENEKAIKGLKSLEEDKKQKKKP